MKTLDWGDPEAVRTWAVDLRAHVDDAIHAGFDATAAPGDRMLGRKAAREQITEAEQSIGESFVFAGLNELNEGTLATLARMHRGAPREGGDR